MSDFNVTVTVRNAHILRAIRRTHDSIAAFCKDAGIGYSGVIDLVGMRASPFLADGSLSTAAENLCRATGMYPSDLWPREMAKIKNRRSSREIEISEAEMMAICGDPETRTIQRELLAKWASKLRPREIEAIGISQSGGTLEEVGGALGVSRARARQIIEKGYRRMREAAKRQNITCLADLTK